MTFSHRRKEKLPVNELGYGYVSICETCGRRESAEHSQECFDAIFQDNPCFCGAEQEFAEYENTRMIEIADAYDVH